MKRILFSAVLAASFGLIAAEPAAAPAENLALGKTVSASTVESERLRAENAVDGKTNTRYQAKYYDNQWFTVDLGKPCAVGRVVLTWGSSAAKEFKIEISNDNKTWKEAFARKDGKLETGRESFTFAPQEARYVRMNGRIRVGAPDFRSSNLESTKSSGCIPVRTEPVHCFSSRRAICEVNCR